LIELFEQRQRIAAALGANGARKLFQSWRRPREMAREQHFECIRRQQVGVKELPVSFVEPVGNRNWI
jgi:hypothetical protein